MEEKAAKKRRIDRAVVKTAFVKSLPVMFSYLFIGIAYGMTMEEAGLKWYWSLAVSSVVYTGAFQFVLISFLADGVSLGVIALTALLMNGRQLFYSVTFLEDFSRTGARSLFMIHSMTDETYAVNLSLPADMENRREGMFGVALLSWLYWAAATVCGCVIGNLIPWDMSGIDFCMTALFAIILIDQWEKAKNHSPALLGGAIALVCLAIFGGQSFVLTALVLTSAVLLIPGRKGARAK